MVESNRNLNHKYEYVGFLSKSVRIKEKGFWGINDFDGNEILPSNYIEVFTLSSGYGLIAARDAGFYDIYDFSGNKINSERFDYLYPYYGLFGLTKVRIGESWGIINKHGRVIVPIKYKRIDKFGKGMILREFDSNLEYIDKDELFKLSKVKHSIIDNAPKIPVRKKLIAIPLKKTKTA